MSKQNLLTVMGVALAFIIAIGGWALTSALIEMKSDALLSATGNTHINVRPINTSDAPDADGDDGQRLLLSEEEIAAVLQNWESPGFERAHEPMEGQLTMEEAIDEAKTALDYFNEQGVIPAELLEYETMKTSAYLCQKQLHEQLSETLDSKYSYWNVSFANEYTNIVLVIHAMTGQIWKARIMFSPIVFDFNAKNAELTLDAFMSYLKIGNNEKISVTDEKTEIRASKAFADGAAYVEVMMNGRRSEDRPILTEIHMVLSTRKSSFTVVDADLNP